MFEWSGIERDTRIDRIDTVVTIRQEGADTPAVIRKLYPPVELAKCIAPTMSPRINILNDQSKIRCGTMVDLLL
jgi:hypothetical protein